ncbi:hypothetical protein D9R19_01600 [Corynebacterium diphtheriae]|nr:hypothetical protein E4651_00815 [Corynebacterium diphtheriae]RKW92901.1 hypothetical protein D9B36_01620 [Corynebacterium diphtheriae]RLP11278.1 hypothetical protein D9R17_01645 [Corynebacterium diphtheriae]RLP19436.1 hypothetical protein D9R19_01600 [Corynebacterium diphtheriae]
MCARRKALCMPRLSPTFIPGGSLGGRYQTPCAPKRCRCKLSIRRSCVLRKQQVSFTIRIMARSTSALSTTSALPSTGLPLLLGQLATPMTMLWLKTLTAPHKNELIHTRRWNDVVEVEIATFEWVSWWNETRLHQSLGYRTPVEVETEFWKQNPPQVKIEIKANA